MQLSLDQLVYAIPFAWSPETRGAERYSGQHPAAGQCVVSSLLIKRHCGGDIVYCQVGGNRQSDRTVHYFNELPGRVKVDVTAAQFLRVSPYRKFKVNPPENTYIFNDTWGRVDLLESRVLDVLDGRY